jgi:hypothetical protein
MQPDAFLEFWKNSRHLLNYELSRKAVKTKSVVVVTSQIKCGLTLDSQDFEAPRRHMEAPKNQKRAHGAAGPQKRWGPLDFVPSRYSRDATAW